ncbi:MAG: hypothetical protein JWM33_870 [Caulobacteraceae bacterium]|nr:hypothetical protein [Caulobacteraceae bacterium]
MSVQLRVSHHAADRRSGVLPETRLCLALMSAGLSALASLSSQSREAIVGSLDETMAGDLMADRWAAEILSDLRDRMDADSGSQAALARKLQEALLDKAMAVPDLPGSGGVVLIG